MKEVLKKIKPSKEEEKKFKEIVGSFIKKLNPNLKQGKALLGGSGAKDTWLSGNHDADVFVAFTSSLNSKQLSDNLEKSLKKSFPKQKIARVHGSRDYFQMQYQELDFEIIPILKINKAEKAVNITDISPLHSKWVDKNGKGKKDEIRLAKQFCIANKLYGAESFINGFSGYVLEILTIYYGSFEKLLKAAGKWKDKEIIDPSKFYKKKMALFDINKSKLSSPIIVVDPVDKTRNAAAALSLEKFSQFKKLAGKYLKNPNVKFFEKRKITMETLKKEKGHKLFLQITPLKGKKDVIGARLLKIFNYLQRKLGKFSVKKSDWDWDFDENAEMYFVLDKKELPQFEERQGPPLKMKEAVKAFKKKNKDTSVKKGRVFAKIKVKHPKLKDFVSDALKDEYVKDKFNKVKVNVF